MFSPNRKSVIHESPLIITIRLLILTTIIISTLLFFCGLITKNLELLFMVFPLGLTSSISLLLYQKIKGEYIKRNKQKLVEIIRQGASFLEMKPPQLTKYDIALSSKTGFVWEGVISSYLISTAHFLNHTRYLIISEDHGRSKNWSCDPESTILTNVASITKKMANAISDDDTVLTFQSIGELYALSLQNRRCIEKKPSVSYSNESFIEDISNISTSLKQRNLFEADMYQEKLIENLKQENPPQKTIYKWQALIAYWIWLRLSLLNSINKKGFVSGWLDPYSVLYRQIDVIIRYFKNEDWMDVSEIIYGSFDWRTWIPRISL